MINQRIVTFFAILFLFSGCAKKHSRINEEIKKPPEEISAGGSGGEIENVAGGTGGEPTEVGIDPTFEERTLINEAPTPIRCSEDGQVQTNVCGNMPVIQTSPEQVNERAWRIEVCAGLSQRIEPSCANRPLKETIIAWTAPQEGYYTFRSLDNTLSIRNQCDDPSSEIACANFLASPQKFVLGAQAQANETFYLIVEREDDDNPHQITIQLVEGPSAPQIHRIEQDTAQYGLGRYSPQITIYASDPNGDIIGFQYQYFDDPNGEPLQIYETNLTPHPYEPTIYLDQNFSLFTLSTQQFKRYYSRSATLPLGATHFRVRAIDASNLTSEFTDPLLIFDVPDYQPDQSISEGRTCQQNDENVVAAAAPNLFCQRAFDEPVPTWKAYQTDRYNSCTTSIEIESSRAYLKENHLGIEAIVRTNFVETVPASLSVDRLRYSNPETGRAELLKNLTPLHLRVTQISENRFRIRRSWILPKNINNAEVSFRVSPDRVFAECHSSYTRVEAEDFPIIENGQACDPSLATNLCMENTLCILTNDLSQLDTSTCQTLENSPIPNITIASHTIREKKYLPYQNSVSLGVHLSIEDPEESLIDLQLRIDYEDDERQTQSMIRPLPIEDLSLFKTETGYEIKLQEEFPYPNGEFRINPREEQFFVKVIDQYGRTGPWVELPILPTPILPEGSSCHENFALADCTEGTYCNLEAFRVDGICEAESSPQIQNLTAYFHAPLEPEKLLNWRQNSQTTIHRSRTPQIFVMMDGVSDASIEDYKVEIQILNEQNEPLLDHERIWDAEFHRPSHLPPMNQEMIVEFDENTNQFQAEFQANIIVAQENYYHRYADNLISSFFPSVEEIEEAFANTRLQIRLIKENGNQSEIAETPILPLPPIEEYEACDNSSGFNDCDENLACASSQQEAPTCTPLDELEATCPPEWNVISLNDSQDEDDAQNLTLSWTHENLFTIDLEYSPSSCGQSVGQKVYSFTAPENLEGPTFFQVELNGYNKSFSIRRSCAWIETEVTCELDCENYECDFSRYGDHASETISSIITLNPSETIYIFPQKQVIGGSDYLELHIEPYAPSQVITEDENLNLSIHSEVYEQTLADETLRYVRVHGHIPIQFGSLNERNKRADRFVFQIEILSENNEILESNTITPWSQSSTDENSNIAIFRYRYESSVTIEDEPLIHRARINVFEKGNLLNDNPILLNVEHAQLE